MQQHYPIYRIVLSGGPSSGKSTSLARLRNVLLNQGWEVFCCPEVPTIMLTAGAKYAGVSQEQLVQTETAYLSVQQSFERNMYRLAKSCNHKAVIIFDRGCMDIKAYLDDQTWN